MTHIAKRTLREFGTESKAKVLCSGTRKRRADCAPFPVKAHFGRECAAGTMAFNLAGNHYRLV